MEWGWTQSPRGSRPCASVTGERMPCCIAVLRVHVALRRVHIASPRVHIALLRVQVALLRVHVALLRVHIASPRVHVALRRVHVALRRVHVVSLRVHVASPRVQVVWRRVHASSPRVHLAWRHFHASSLRVQVAWRCVHAISPRVRSTCRSSRLVRRCHLATSGRLVLAGRPRLGGRWAETHAALELAPPIHITVRAPNSDECPDGAMIRPFRHSSDLPSPIVLQVEALVSLDPLSPPGPQPPP